MLTRILLVESSVKLVARNAVEFGDFQDGTSCHPSNERIALETGLSERTVRTAWAVLRGLRMAERVGYGIAHRRLADEYELRIPTSWRSLPVIGPHARKFTCPQCRKLFLPQANCTVNSERDDPPDTVRFTVQKMAFCSYPRRGKSGGAKTCLTLWNASRRKAGQPAWNEPGHDAWDTFREARGDDW